MKYKLAGSIIFAALILILNCEMPAMPAKCTGCSGCPGMSSIAVNTEKSKDVLEPPAGSSDEFEPVADSGEFLSADSAGQFVDAREGSPDVSGGINWRMLYWPLGAIGFTILAGFFVRYKPTRAFKALFLVASAVFLGFYNGACPCPISSMSFAIIGISGGDINWESTVWFLGLIPVTYLLGQVWCGWVCHLGALQEFIYRRNKLKFLQGATAQGIMKAMRWLLLAALISQLIYTQTYLFDVIDPFRIAFNLGYGADTLGWVLLGLLLFTSVFIYRPFCRAACPIGLVYGWIAKIPGASVLGKAESCTGCVSCARACSYQAVNRSGNLSILDNRDCIMCGDCIDECRPAALKFYRKGRANPAVVVLDKGNAAKSEA